MTAHINIHQQPSHTHHVAETHYPELAMRLMQAALWRNNRYGKPGDIDWNDVAVEAMKEVE